MSLPETKEAWLAAIKRDRASFERPQFPGGASHSAEAFHHAEELLQHDWAKEVLTAAATKDYGAAFGNFDKIEDQPWAEEVAKNAIISALSRLFDDDSPGGLRNPDFRAIKSFLLAIEEQPYMSRLIEGLNRAAKREDMARLRIVLEPYVNAIGQETVQRQGGR